MMKRSRSFSLLAPLLLLALLLAAGGSARAEEGQVYQFPEIRPHFDFTAGYRFVSRNGSSRAGEYEYLHNSVYGSGEISAFPFPHRFHYDFEFRNEKDYFSDLRYAYRDIVLTRWVRRALFHNLLNIPLVDLGPDPQFTVDRRDAGVEYGIDTVIDDAFVRVKAPNYPFHVFVSERHVKQDGSLQQRFLGGSGWFNDLARTSQSRRIDNETHDITVGANGHFGPVEVEYSHGEKWLNPGGDEFLVENYNPAVFPPAINSAGGILPHNLTPELEGSTNTVKIHTSYTGQVVAAATVSHTDRDNTTSGAGYDSLLAAGDIRWSPYPYLSLTVKYRHQDVDVENPSSLPAGYLGFPAFPATTGIRNSISYDVDAVSASVRYRVTRGSFVILKYGYKEKKRERNEEWNLPRRTRDQALSLDGKFRLSRALKLRTSLSYRAVDDPAYNTEPDDGYAASAALSWRPLPRISTYVGYRWRLEKRDTVAYESGSTGDDRRVRKDTVRASITATPLESLVVHASYSYLENDVEQDLAFGTTVEEGVEYEGLAHNYALSLAYTPRERLHVNTGVRHTRSRGNFAPDPHNLADLSAFKIRETEYHASGSYRLPSGWGAGCDFRFTEFENVAENPDNPELSDGEVYTFILTARKEF
jgi:hypothetical protein